MNSNSVQGTVTDAVIVEVHDEKATQACRDILAVIERATFLEAKAWPVQGLLVEIADLARDGLQGKR